MRIKNRQNWTKALGFEAYAFPTKDELVESYISYMLSKTSQIFIYDNLPPHCDKNGMEAFLQTRGFIAIKHLDASELLTDDKESGIYYSHATVTDEPNYEYRPKKILITNPYLYVSKTPLIIDKDVCVIYNDYQMQGLMPLFIRYANLMAECDLTIRRCIINARFPAIIGADNDTTKKDIDKLFEDIEKGDMSHAVGWSSFFDGMQSAVYAPAVENTLRQAVETLQYLKSSWWLEIGLQSNYNMKREAINGNEAGMNQDALIPFVDEMLEMRQVGWDKINAIYGTDVKVRLSDVWQKTYDDATTSEVERTESEPIAEESQESTEVKEDEPRAEAD